MFQSRGWTGHSNRHTNFSLLGIPVNLRSLRLKSKKQCSPIKELHFSTLTQIYDHFFAALTLAHLALTPAAIAALPAALIFLFAGFTSDLAGASAVFPALTLAQRNF